jgi:hypothetical protein
LGDPLPEPFGDPLPDPPRAGLKSPAEGEAAGLPLPHPAVTAVRRISGEATAKKGVRRKECLEPLSAAVRRLSDDSPAVFRVLKTAGSLFTTRVIPQPPAYETVEYGK